MARLRLTEPHYIFTDPDTVWERLETDSVSGRQVRKQYVVPKYFHHEIEADWNDKEEKAVVVSDGHNAKKTDIIFKGEPTPGMLGLDDEAKEISAKFKDKWNIPDNIKWGPGEYSGALSDYFVQQQDKVNLQMAKTEEDRARSTDKFQESMLATMAQNQQILALLAGAASGEANA